LPQRVIIVHRFVLLFKGRSLIRPDLVNRTARQIAVCRYDDRRTKAPSDEGKQSAVAVVNDSPVDCQSRDRIARRQLSAEQADWGREKGRFLLPLSQKSNRFLTAPLTRGAPGTV